jgi:hypothetical protein
MDNQIDGHSGKDQNQHGEGQNIPTISHGGFHAKEAKEARNDRTWTLW